MGGGPIVTEAGEVATDGRLVAVDGTAVVTVGRIVNVGGNDVAAIGRVIAVNGTDVAVGAIVPAGLQAVRESPAIIDNTNSSEILLNEGILFFSRKGDERN